MRYDTDDYVFIFDGEINQVKVWSKSEYHNSIPLDSFTPDITVDNLETVAKDWIHENTVTL